MSEAVDAEAARRCNELFSGEERKGGRGQRESQREREMWRGGGREGAVGFREFIHRPQKGMLIQCRR